MTFSRHAPAGPRQVKLRGSQTGDKSGILGRRHPSIASATPPISVSGESVRVLHRVQRRAAPRFDPFRRCQVG